jgi:hypothetical protein
LKQRRFALAVKSTATPLALLAVVDGAAVQRCSGTLLRGKKYCCTKTTRLRVVDVAAAAAGQAPLLLLLPLLRCCD